MLIVCNADVFQGKSELVSSCTAELSATPSAVQHWHVLQHKVFYPVSAFYDLPSLYWIAVSHMVWNSLHDCIAVHLSCSNAACVSAHHMLVTVQKWLELSFN